MADDPAFDNLYPAVIQCFVIILSGYLAGRLSLISCSEAQGVNTFVSHFSLPALIFTSMAGLDFSVVNWSFLLSIFLSKTFVFVMVAMVTVVVHRPFNVGKAGLYSIFCTQSNDFALGFPIVVALYQKTHPEYASYLYLVAPISLVFLNPIGFIMMEVERRRAGEGRDSVGGSQTRMLLHILHGVLFNPIILMTLAGILGNFIFRQRLPVILEGVLTVLGSAFPATALFCLGLRMVGKVAKLRGKALVLPAILITVKTLLLPLVIRETTSLLNSGGTPNATLDLSTYGFLYGTFPSAPSVFVFASQYNLDVDLIASSMVACTFLSAPLMFVSAKMIALQVITDQEYLPDLNKFLFNVSIIGLFCTTWVLVVFLLSKKWRKVPHCMTMCLIVSQLMACIGAVLWNALDCTESWQLYLQFVLFTVGVYSARIWTALLALSLLVLRWRSLCYLLRLRPYFAVIGWGIPCTAVIFLCLLSEREYKHKDKSDPNFQYGTTQATIGFLITLGSLLVTVVCVSLQQRFQRRYSEYQSLLRDAHIQESDTSSLLENADSLIEEEPTGDCCATIVDVDKQDQFACCRGESCVTKPGPDVCCMQEGMQDVEDISPCQERQQDRSAPDLCAGRFPCTPSRRLQCSSIIRTYRSCQSLDPQEAKILRDTDEEFQLLRHVILLLMLCVSMIVGVALCAWRLIAEKPSGIYVELEFLDGVLNFGQGLLVFTVFGFDTKLVVLPFVRRWRKLWYGAETVVLPDLDDLEAETRQTCEQFMMYHYEKCARDIVRDRRWRTQKYKSVFLGTELVNWLILVGLAKDRSEAVRYGRNLLLGRRIQHVNNQHQFLDMPYFYSFIHSGR